MKGGRFGVGINELITSSFFLNSGEPQGHDQSCFNIIMIKVKDF